MRYLAVFDVEYPEGTKRIEKVIERGYVVNPNNLHDMAEIEGNEPLPDNDRIIFASLVGLHGLND